MFLIKNFKKFQKKVCQFPNPENDNQFCFLVRGKNVESFQFLIGFFVLKSIIEKFKKKK